MGKIVLFDMDGTILDSMRVWRDEGVNILKESKIPHIEEIISKFSQISAIEVANHIESNGLSDIPGTKLIEMWREKMLHRYLTDIVAKPHIEDIFKKCKEKGYRIVLTTGTPLPISKKALERNGLLHYFDAFYDEYTIGHSKREDHFFKDVLEKEGYAANDAIIVDDAVFALKCAKHIGATSIGVSDALSKPLEEEIKKYSDIYVEDFLDLVDKI